MEPVAAFCLSFAICWFVAMLLLPLVDDREDK